MTRASLIWLAKVLTVFVLGVLVSYGTMFALYAVARSY